MAGHFGRYWEMRRGQANDPKGAEEIFKCEDCGAESEHPAGWNGEPDAGRCHKHCRSRSSDWRPGRVTDAYRENYERTFRNGGA